MSIIYECDGCDEQTKDPKKVSMVTVEIKSDALRTDPAFHLCVDCERHLREVANPASWPRAVRAT